MSSGFSGGGHDFFTGGGRSSNINSSYSTNLNPQQQFQFPPPLSGILHDPNSQIRRPDLIVKRSLAEFQQQNQQGLGFYPRNVKFRPNYQHASPISPVSQVDYSPVPSNSTQISSVSNPLNLRYGHPILYQHQVQPLNVLNGNSTPNLAGNRIMGMNLPGLVSGQECEKKMMNNRLQELEKELLGDEEDGEAVSVITNSEWSETIRNLIGPTQKPISPSPTSSSSSCNSTSASPAIPCTKQSLIDAAVAISEEKPAVAAEIITRLQQVANPTGTPEQRLTAYMVSALKSRVNPIEHPFPVSELHGKEHTMSTQMLYEVSPCFKLGFMAANLAILEATSELSFEKIHVVDFDIGEGGQYVHFLHALLAKKSDGKRAAALKITAFTDFIPGSEELFLLVDKALGAGSIPDEACKYLKIGLLCAQECAKERPTMSVVAKMLKGEINVDKMKMPKPGKLMALFTQKSSNHEPHASFLGSCFCFEPITN